LGNDQNKIMLIVCEFSMAVIVGSVVWVPIYYWFHNFIVSFVIYVIVFEVFCMPLLNKLDAILKEYLDKYF
jgi:hypothetical protein